MTQVDDSILETVKDVNKRWGGESEFEIEIIEDWKKVIKNWKKDGGESNSSDNVWYQYR